MARVAYVRIGRIPLDKDEIAQINSRQHGMLNNSNKRKRLQRRCSSCISCDLEKGNSARRMMSKKIASTKNPEMDGLRVEVKRDEDVIHLIQDTQALAAKTTRKRRTMRRKSISKNRNPFMVDTGFKKDRWIYDPEYALERAHNRKVTVAAHKSHEDDMFANQPSLFGSGVLLLDSSGSSDVLNPGGVDLSSSPCGPGWGMSSAVTEGSTPSHSPEFRFTKRTFSQHAHIQKRLNEQAELERNSFVQPRCASFSPVISNPASLEPALQGIRELAKLRRSSLDSSSEKEDWWDEEKDEEKDWWDEEKEKKELDT
jgi:hypothetical protein